MNNLDKLEAEAIYIIREVVVNCKNPVMLYSVGKDSSVMMHLAFKAFYPEKPPFPFLHIDTTWKFHEMIEFRDVQAKKYGIELLVYTNSDGVKNDIHERDLEFMKNVSDTSISIANKFNWSYIECIKDNEMRTIEDIHEDVYKLVRQKIK